MRQNFEYMFSICIGVNLYNLYNEFSIAIICDKF